MPENAGIILIIEGSSDLRVVRGLAELALLKATPDFVPDFFAWRGLEEHLPFLLWQDVDDELKQRKMSPLYGKFNGVKGSPYAFRTRHALLLAHHANPLAVVLVCDADTQPQRLLGLQQARDSHFSHKYPIVVAAANPCREAWLICAFQAEYETEKDLLETLQKELSFHPCHEPERLNTVRGHARSAKTLRDLLTSESLQREQAILEKADLTHLQANGIACGLAGKEKLAPLLGVKS